MGFFGCYLLDSQHPQSRTRTYIGFTVNPRRRIRQHNGLITNGAWRTSKWRPWEMTLVLYGFPTMVLALQFEWAWQHPARSRDVKHTAARLGERGMVGVKGKMRLMLEMLHLPPWCYYPLTLQFLSSDYAKLYAELKQAPPHVQVRVGPLSDLPEVGDDATDSDREAPDAAAAAAPGGGEQRFGGSAGAAAACQVAPGGRLQPGASGEHRQSRAAVAKAGRTKGGSDGSSSSDEGRVSVHSDGGLTSDGSQDEAAEGLEAGQGQSDEHGDLAAPDEAATGEMVAGSSTCAMCEERIVRHLMQCPCGSSFHIECLAKQWVMQAEDREEEEGVQVAGLRGKGGSGEAARSLTRSRFGEVPEHGLCPACQRPHQWLALLCGMKCGGWQGKRGTRRRNRSKSTKRGAKASAPQAATTKAAPSARGGAKGKPKGRDATAAAAASAEGAAAGAPAGPPPRPPRASRAKRSVKAAAGVGAGQAAQEPPFAGERPAKEGVAGAEGAVAALARGNAAPTGRAPAQHRGRGKAAQRHQASEAVLLAKQEHLGSQLEVDLVQHDGVAGQHDRGKPYPQHRQQQQQQRNEDHGHDCIEILDSSGEGSDVSAQAAGISRRQAMQAGLAPQLLQDHQEAPCSPAPACSSSEDVLADSAEEDLSGDELDQDISLAMSRWQQAGHGTLPCSSSERGSAAVQAPQGWALGPPQVWQQEATAGVGSSEAATAPSVGQPQSPSALANPYDCHQRSTCGSEPCADNVESDVSIDAVGSAPCISLCTPEYSQHSDGLAQGSDGDAAANAAFLLEGLNVDTQQSVEAMSQDFAPAAASPEEALGVFRGQCSEAVCSRLGGPDVEAQGAASGFTEFFATRRAPEAARKRAHHAVADSSCYSGGTGAVAGSREGTSAAPVVLLDATPAPAFARGSNDVMEVPDSVTPLPLRRRLELRLAKPVAAGGSQVTTALATGIMRSHAARTDVIVLTDSD